MLYWWYMCLSLCFYVSSYHWKIKIYANRIMTAWHRIQTSFHGQRQFIANYEYAWQILTTNATLVPISSYSWMSAWPLFKFCDKNQGEQCQFQSLGSQPWSCHFLTLLVLQAKPVAVPTGINDNSGNFLASLRLTSYY